MALTAYQQATQRLLQNPAAPTSLYATSDLTVYINSARGQLAAEGECIRFQPSLTVTVGVRIYPFSSISLAGGTGLKSVMNVRTAWYAVASGQQWLTPRGFEWFSLYYLNNPVPPQAAPKRWSQFGQGTAGTLYFDPVPDTNYTLSFDSVCLPIDLVDDTTVEAIPPLWTDAVPYYAAYLALLGAQTSARTGEAQKMYQLYELFVKRARDGANPSVLTTQYPQSQQPTRMNQLGIAPARQQAAV